LDCFGGLGLSFDRGLPLTYTGRLATVLDSLFVGLLCLGLLAFGLLVLGLLVLGLIVFALLVLTGLELGFGLGRRGGGAP
jgi:hypothetical protein